jgi:hypothetical protein
MDYLSPYIKKLIIKIDTSSYRDPSSHNILPLLNIPHSVEYIEFNIIIKITQWCRPRDIAKEIRDIMKLFKNPKYKFIVSRRINKIKKYVDISRDGIITDMFRGLFIKSQ